MQTFRKQIEEWLKTCSDIIYDNRYKTLLIILILSAGVISQLHKITVNTSLEGLLHKKDPVLLEYNGFRDQFGREELIVIAVKTKNVFDMDFIRKLKKLHDELDQNVPMIEKIDSLITARNTYGKNDELRVDELFETFPETPEDLNKIKERVLNTPMFKHTLVSEDQTYATILIQTVQHSSSGKETESLLGGFDEPSANSQKNSDNSYLTDEENSEIVQKVNEIARKYDAPGFRIHIAGSPAVTHALKIALFRDMTLFSIISSITISLFLYLLFTRLSGILFPLIIVEISLILTVSIMAITGAVLKIPFSILPSFILTVGVGDAVHILSLFYRNFDKTGDKRAAISHAIGHSGLAIILTSVTTAGGLLSFIAADIAPVADLGLYASIGVIIALFYTIILLPALISIFPIKRKFPASSEKNPSLLDNTLSRISDFAINRPVSVLLASVVLLIISVYGATKIQFFHNVVQWFPETDDIRIGTESIDNDLRGSISLEVVIDTKKENGIYDPDFLQRVDKVSSELETFSKGDMFVGKAWSITTIIKEINRALSNNDQAYYFLPDRRNVIAQEILLFENSGSDDISDYTDTQFRKCRIIIKVPAIDAIQYSAFISHVETLMKKEFPDCSVEVTGMMAILFSTIKKLISSMVKSYAIALVVITILMILLIGKIKLGLLSMIPNLFPIVAMLGIMGWLKIPMDMFAVLVGSIAIGIIVDDTVHFMHNFRRNMEEMNDAEKAAKKTIMTTGPAMFVTSLVLSTGFFTYMLSSMNNLFNFGLLTGITIIIALSADFLIAPSLMVIAHKKK